jgi:hypothetical protein
VRPSRRSQPYRKGLGTKLAGAAHDAMLRGRAQGMSNPQDVKRLGQKMARRVRPRRRAR